MKIHRILPLLYIGLTLFTSCSTADDNPELPETENYADGIFILNEGNYGSGNSTVSYLAASKEEINHEIFRNQNAGLELGDVGQSMAFFNDYVFVVVNVSNTIEVVDRTTFKHIMTISTDIQNPRYIAFSEGKAFVSNWGEGSNPDDDFITVINASTFAVEKKIAVSEGPDKIISGGRRIFVAHSGGHSINNIVSVIDPVKGDLITTVTAGDQPNSMQLDGDFLWVLSSGKPSYLNDESAGSLSKIDVGTNEKVQELVFSNTTDHPANLELENGNLYYTMNNAVYSFNRAENTLSETSLFSIKQVDYLYGFEVQGSEIYAASASMDFTGNGKLFIYDLSGNLLNSFETGINPNGIYFNN